MSKSRTLDFPEADNQNVFCSQDASKYALETVFMQKNDKGKMGFV